MEGISFFEPIKIEKLSVESILSGISSGIGLDIAKNHTGVCIWEQGVVTTYGFMLSEYAKEDYHAEYKMRVEFKEKLKEIIKGKVFEYCIVEDVYGGTNFDTTRKLLALNTVIDELIFESSCKVEHFVRWNATKWLSYLRGIYKGKGKSKSKIETQAVLEYLGFEFYIKNKDLGEGEKEAIFFEDICDATAMLCSVALQIQKEKMGLEKKQRVTLKSVKMKYIESLDSICSCRDKRIREEVHIEVELNVRNIEKSILKEIENYPNSVLSAYLPVDKLGVFGIKNKLPFYESGEGYLLFYKK